MHRKHIRATLAGVDVDVPTGVFVDQQFLRFIGGKIETAFALAGISSSTDNAVVRWDGTSGHFVQNSTVIINDSGDVTGVTTLNTRDVARWVDGPLSVGLDSAVALWDNSGVDGRLLKYSTIYIDGSGNITGVTSINGLTWTGDYVRGPTPAVAVDDHIATWDSTSGRLIQDSGLHIGDVVFNFDAEAITNNLPKFFDSTGRRLTDSGIPAANVVQSPSTSTDNAVARYDGTTGKFIQNSVVIISDAGAVTGVTTLNGVAPGNWVVGPASVTADSNVPLFSGTSGKIIYDSTVPFSLVVRSVFQSTIAGRVTYYNDASGNQLTYGVLRQDRVMSMASAGAGTVGNVPIFTGNDFNNGGFQDSAVYIYDLVKGPSSATDNAIARYDATTGKLIQNSLLTVSDTGDLAGVVQINSINIANYMITSTGNSIGRVPVYNSGTSVTQSSITISSGNVLGNVATLNGTDPATWVVGPSSATDGRVAVYDGTTGKLLKNGTKLEADVVTGPSSTTSGLVAVFSGITGKIIASGTRQESVLVAGPAVVADNTLTRFDGTTGKLVQGSNIVVDDSGNISSAGTYNSVNVASHAARHMPGGADSLFDTTATSGRVIISNGTGNALGGRFIQGFATRANASVSTTDEVIVAFVLAEAGDYLLRVSCPYALLDTSGNIVVSALFGGTGMVSVAIGQGQGRITSSGGTVSVATSSAPPSGVIFIDFLCTGLAASDVMYALVRKSTGTAMAIYKGTAILMTAAASP